MINVEFSLCAITGVWIYWLFYILLWFL